MKFKLNKDIFIIFDSNKTPYLLGPRLNNFTRINDLKALLYHYFSVLKEFTIEDILNKYKNDCNKQVNSVEEVILKKEFNWFKDNNFLVLENSNFKESKEYYIEYTFSNKENKEFKLSASVLKSSLATQWCFALSFQLQNSPSLLRNGLFYGNTFQSLEDVSKKIHKISEKCEKILKDFFEFNLDFYFNQKITKDSLWKLHKAFEDYYPKVLTLLEENKNNSELEDLNNLMRDLNYYIHMAEDILNNWEGGFIEIIFPKSTYPIPISSEKNELFSTKLLEKHIYLNYYQIGYSVLAAYEAGTDSKPNPQSSFCANHFIYSRPNVELLKKDQYEQIKNWLREKHNLDINDLSLRLGHVPLAKLNTELSYIELNNILKNFQTLTNISVKEV